MLRILRRLVRTFRPLRRGSHLDDRRRSSETSQQLGERLSEASLDEELSEGPCADMRDSASKALVDGW